MIPYNRFYRRFGMLRVRQLATPRRVPLSLIELPRESVLHYLPQSQTDTGPTNDEYLFRTVSKPIMMQHVTELTHKDGNPILKPEPILNAVRDYHLKNRRYRRLKDLSIINRDPMTQVVINYCWISQRYRYPKTQFAKYYAWSNLQHTFWKQVNQTATDTGRQQFIQIQLPTTLPSLSELVRFSETFNAQVLRIFHTPELLMFLELWKWLSTARAQSVLRHISPANLDKINILLMDRQAWTLINLGRVNAARKATEAELLLDPNAPDKGLDPAQVAKFLLMGAHDLIKRRSIGEEDLQREFEAEADEDDAVIDREDLLDEAATSTDPNESASQEPVKKVIINPFDIELKGDETIIDLTGDDSTPEALEALSKRIDEELAEIDRRKNFTADTLSEDALAELGLEPEDLVGDDGEEKSAEEPTLKPLPEYGETPDELFRSAMDDLASQGALSPAEQTRFLRLAQSYKAIELENGQTLDEFMVIEPEALEIKEPEPPKVGGITNQAMVGSTLDVFDSQYIENVMDKDIVASIMSIQAAGFAVTGFKRTLTESIDGDYYEYFIRVVPIDGAPSTIRISMPKVQEDGTFMVGGVTYRFRKQQGVHLPIAKVSDSKVALTSYFAKNFVTRPQIKAADYGYWLCNAIKLKSLEGTQIKDAEMIESFDPELQSPRLYSYLAKVFSSFKLIYEGNEYHFYLSQKDRTEFFTEAAINQLEHQGTRLIGRAASGVIYVDIQDNLFVFDGSSTTALPSIESMLGLQGNKAPLEYSQLSVMGRDIPIGFILAHEGGLTRLLQETKAQVRRVPQGTRLSLSEDEYAIRFADESLVLSRKDVYATLLFSGFTKYRQSIANYNVHEFDQKDVYLNVLEESGLSARILSEIELRYKMFVDPITREILVDMKEPTTYGGLLRRATELLMTDYVPNTKNRVRGYERFAGALYNELVRSVRAHQNSYGRERLQLDVNPYSVQQAILTDSAKMLVSEINPIEDLKQIEAMSYSGTGGRDSGTMTKPTRAYKKNEQGLVSEATVDSGKVAVNTHTSANPKFNSVRGTYDEFVLGEDDPSRLVSTSALLSPGADRDDAKRTNFISIQHGHGISCEGYQANPVRTGYEQVLATRTSKAFAYTAKEDGEVVSIKKDGIIIEYVSGKRVGVELGRIYGIASSLTFPYSITTPMSAGQRFKKGDVVAYNEQFFERDFLNPGGVVYKGSMPVMVALMENPATYEDSSSISQRIADKFATTLTHVTKVVIRVDQSIHNIVKVGTEVGSRDQLCILEDSITADSGLFDAETLATLSTLGAQAPRAGVNGVIDHIEVRYNADLEMMSDTVRELAVKADKHLAAKRKAVNKKPLTNKVSEGYRVDGAPLLEGTMEIKFYINQKLGAMVGDKFVFGNQLKTIVGEVTPKPMETESGVTVDAKFGSIAVGARIVRSPYIIGTTSILLKILGKRAARAYRGDLS